MEACVRWRLSLAALVTTIVLIVPPAASPQPDGPSSPAEQRHQQVRRMHAPFGRVALTHQSAIDMLQ
jgi:hypothetical protein